jgi:uncharacterized protein (UPF0333 family)
MINKKGQGTIEYLIIIAIVVVIALVVVSLLLDVMSNSGGVGEQTAKAAWQSSEPWGVVEWSMNSDGNLTVVLKNNSFDSLEFNELTVSGTTSTTAATTVPPGATQNVLVPSISGTYTAGQPFSLPQDEILIDFNTGNINNRIQYGAADIVGTVQ